VYAFGEGKKVKNNMRVTAIGSLLSAFLASLCCVGPLMLGIIGVGAGVTSSYVKALVPYRPVFIALTFFLLAVGFFSVYRRKEACSTDSACPTRGTKALKIALWVATIGALILILLPDLLAVGI
jgi:mercuric ion transport protein